ncbi:energy-coupling factor transporter transmembrane protein EcfT, partial [Staphylococcus saprophyticus]|nr:energy-coupling factor transporter transmembrane protein EcfT [Staphylococcus saprophyticus]
HAPFSYKDILLIIVMGLILISAYYLSLYFPITGIDDVRTTSIY